MIPEHHGPYRPLSETIRACEEHRARLMAGYVQAIVDGRDPTDEQVAEYRRAERERRVVARMRARSAVQREARRVVEAEYRRWLTE